MATLYNYVNGLSEDTTPVVADDFVLTVDASASALKKVKLHRLGQGKQTIWIPAGAMIAATTSGPAAAQQESSTNDVNYNTLAFDGAADEFAHFSVAFPKGWDEGTVTAQFVWSSTGTDTDAVIWGIQGLALSDNEAIDASWGTAVTVTDNLQSAAGELYVTSETSAMTIGGTPAEGDVCFFRVYRDADAGGDTAAEDALLMGVKLFYTTNTSTDA